MKQPLKRFWMMVLTVLVGVGILVTACGDGGGGDNDDTPPEVSLASSSQTVTTAGPITLSATASDDVGVVKVEFFRDGTSIGEDTAEPFEQAVNLTQADNGTLSFSAKAFDAAGNEAESNEVTVEVNISVAILLRPSKSSAIAITGDDRYVVQVNPENDTVTNFRVSTNEKLAELPVGEEPSSVVIHPDDSTAFVANRADATVMKLSGIESDAPSVVDSVDVGSEPTGIALSPRGDLLVVAEFAESRVSLIDTSTMQVITSTEIKNPRAVAISNDGDEDDSDEKVVVTEFYGRPGPGEEMQDDSRTGAVRILNLSDLSEHETVLFEPVSSGFVPEKTSPNQLYAVAIASDTFFVTATAASPQGPPKFNENIFQLVLVGSVSSGDKLGVINLSKAIKDQVASPKLFMADIVDLSLVGDDILYFAARGADAFQRAVLLGNDSVTLGIPGKEQVDLLPDGCQAPIGIVTAHTTATTRKMFVNCWVSRNLTVIDLGQQEVETTVSSTTPPNGLEAQINKGRRFFFTGRARWANEAWSSCGSCHADGLTDNITWQFGTGPRQATSMDSTFSHGPGPQKQRILNWTGIFDELHDFERNTRNVSGGVGALVKAEALDEANRLSLNKIVNGAEAGIGGLEKPLKELQDGVAGPTQTVDAGPSVLKDWDDINEFVKTIRPPRGKRFTDAASVLRGRELFETGNCAACHGGPGWTLSRRFWEPSDQVNLDLAAEPFSAANNPHTTQIQAEPIPGSDPPAFIAPGQVSCVLRNVSSFGVPGNAGATDALELKPGNVNRAQGEFAGYNIPGLYGLQVGTPFLHHGQAEDLEALFEDDLWNAHLLSGNPVFTLSTSQRQDLINFLLSIDASTPEIAPPAGADVCPVSFP